MPIGFRVRASRAFVVAGLSVAGLSLAVNGCAMLQSPPPPGPPPLDAADSGAAGVYLSLADLREDKSDWAGAQSVVDKGLAQRPGNQALLLRRAQILLHRADGEDEPALREQARTIHARFAAAGDASPRDAQSRVARTDDVETVAVQTVDAETQATWAWLDFADGHRDDALAAAHAAADADPGAARVQRILAYLLFRNGDYQAANNAAERALELSPRSRAALRLRARTRVAIADVGGAEADAREVLRSHRDDPESSAILADALLRQADGEAALRVLSGVPRARRNPRVAVPLARLELGVGHTDAGRALLEEAAQQHPNDAQVHEALVALDIRDGRADDSVKRLEAAVAARPDSAPLQRLLAQAFVAERRDDEAGASFVRALALDPNDGASYRALVEWLRARNQSDAAERRAAELGLGAGPTLFTIGMLRDARGDRVGARAHYQKALEADPKLAIARAARAAALAESGEQLDLALTLAREARAMRPRDSEIADTLGLVQLRRGQAEAALEVLGEAAGTHPVYDPGYGAVLYHTAMAFEATRNRESARHTIEVALAVIGDRKPEPGWAANARAVLERTRPAPAPPPAPIAAAPAPAPAAPTTPDPASPAIDAETTPPAAPEAATAAAPPNNPAPPEPAPPPTP